MFFPAREEGRDAVAENRAGKLLVFGPAARTLLRIRDPRRAALEQQGAHAFRPAQGETERQACAHRVSREEERTLRQCDGQLFQRGVPTGCRCALAVPGQVRRGVANSSSKCSVASATGRNWKMPPPSLFTTTTSNGIPSRLAARRPDKSCRSARSPSSTAVDRSVAAAAPSALEMIPSIPLTPRFERTRARPLVAQASTSRTGMLLETNSSDS